MLNLLISNLVSQRGKQDDCIKQQESLKSTYIQQHDR